MEALIKNIPQAAALSLAGQVSCLPGQIVSKTRAQDKRHSLTLFAFDRGEEISTHASDGDAMVIGLEGRGIVTVGGTPHPLEAGETIVMPAQIPHAVAAAEPFKMLLIVIFPQDD